MRSAIDPARYNFVPGAAGPLVVGGEGCYLHTADGRRMQLRIAIDYSSRTAIQASLAPATALGGPPAGSTILPPVDLLLRTGGERRLSDFLLWECAYAELAFLDVMWPELTGAHLDAAFADYAARERRYGAIPLKVSA